MTDRNIKVFSSLDELSTAAAALTVELIRSAPAEARFALVLSGGSTPRRFHEALATRHGDAIPWERVHLFWGDDRFVPHDHPDSNYRMAQETLIGKIDIPEENIHPIRTDLSSPEAAADDQEQMLRAFFGPEAETTFDLTILGLGGDGHTASLFPGTSVLEEKERWAAAMEAPAYASPRERVTMTYPLINRSRHVLFLVAGEGKRGPLRTILDSPEKARSLYPASGVSGQEATHWFVDEAAYGA